MPNNLQQLRKAAGYRTAKDFAEAADIPAPTYTRYEQDPSKIPIERAWIVADFLRCSIDAVVGREPVDPSEMRGPVQRIYDKLSDRNKGMVDDYLEYVRYKDGKERGRDRAQDQRRYEDAVQRYSRQFYEQMGTGEVDLIDLAALGDTDALRSRFLDFVEDQLSAARKAEIDEAVDEAQGSASRDGRSAGWEFRVGDDRFLIKDEDGRHVSLATATMRLESILQKNYEERDLKELELIGDAFDRMRRRRDDFSNPASRRPPSDRGMP